MIPLEVFENWNHELSHMKNPMQGLRTNARKKAGRNRPAFCVSLFGVSCGYRNGVSDAI